MHATLRHRAYIALIALGTTLYSATHTHIPQAHVQLEKHVRADGTLLTSCFSPHDNIINLIIECITRETESIVILAYCFTHPRIARALKEKVHKTNIHVTIIADHEKAIDSRYNYALRSLEQAVDIKLYKPSENGIMHNKCILFSKNLNHAPLIITGSFNLTRSAQRKNCENIIISNDKILYEQYKQTALQLEKNTEPFTLVADKPKYKNVYIKVKDTTKKMVQEYPTRTITKSY
jgi:phosphatidylserine/phosphatidylglycerophosphate/cardiolipin synthase-like enzyme